MLLKSCGRCGNLIPYGAAYCRTCKPIVEAEIAARKEQYKRQSNKVYNAKRDPKYVRFYNSNEWQTLSAKRLSDDDYVCAWCRGVATEADHIVEVKTDEGWARRLDYNNTRSLCHDCHEIRHKRFIKKEKHKRF